MYLVRFSFYLTMVENEDFGNSHVMDYILLMKNKNVDGLYEAICFNEETSVKKNKAQIETLLCMVNIVQIKEKVI